MMQKNMQIGWYMAMNKRRIVLDFDGVVADSVKCICGCFEVLHDKGKYAPSQVRKWNFRDIIPTNNSEVEEMFESSLFWELLTPAKGAIDFINKYRDRIVICSIGSVKNQIQKLKWISANLGEVEMLPVVTAFKENRIDKHMIDMSDCIFVEDSIKNLNNTNAEYKILMNHYDVWDCEWNVDNDNRYPHISTFHELEKIIEQIDE